MFLSSGSISPKNQCQLALEEMFLMDLLLPSLPGMLNHCVCTRDRSTVTPGVWVWADHLRGSNAYRGQTGIISGWSVRHPAPGSTRGCVNLGSLSRRRQTVPTRSIHLSPGGIWAPLCRGSVSHSFSLYLKETNLGSHTDLWTRHPEEKDSRILWY